MSIWAATGTQPEFTDLREDMTVDACVVGADHHSVTGVNEI